MRGKGELVRSEVGSKAQRSSGRKRKKAMTSGAMPAPTAHTHQSLMSAVSSTSVANRLLTGSRIPETPARSRASIGRSDEYDVLRDAMAVDCAGENELHGGRLHRRRRLAEIVDEARGELGALMSFCRSPKGRNVAPPSPTQGIPLKSVGSETTGCMMMQSASASAQACSTMLDFPIPGPLQMRTGIFGGYGLREQCAKLRRLDELKRYSWEFSYRGVIASRSGERARGACPANGDGSRGINGGDPRPAGRKPFMPRKPIDGA